jgi:hypothetical protein
MTFGAHEIPILIEFRPAQNVVVPNVFVRIEMEPTLAALVFRSAVPCDRQSLQPSVRKFDKILLKRIHAERVFHLIGGQFSVMPVGFDEKLRVLAKETRLDIDILKARVVKITEHGLVRCMSHSALMLRRMPKSALGLVTAGTDIASRESCLTRRCCHASAV